ncbi:MAG: glycerol-3-phosphate 1-O-acyltransferase PlsY [Clostridiales bacterium]|jgi:glycerol-3-phosphate acyltransferase PlsY|nr:glycerol-3-phosphate 1-O-acyltransferase PlsY [Clostridiales bacterium]
MQGKALWILFLIALTAYFIGNINFAVLLSRSRNKDVRELGSGNPGTMNMMRNFGAKMGLLTLILDIIKGALPVFAAKMIFQNLGLSGGKEIATFIAMYTAGFFAVLGHIYPVTLRFKGGKGIATTLGVFLIINPVLTLIALAISLIYIILFEYGSVGNLIMITLMCCIEGYRYNSSYPADTNLLALCFLLLGMCFLTWFAHRSNLYRLMMGKEHKTRLIDILKPKRRKKKRETGDDV